MYSGWYYLDIVWMIILFISVKMMNTFTRLDIPAIFLTSHNYIRA